MTNHSSNDVCSLFKPLPNCFSWSFYDFNYCFACIPNDLFSPFTHKTNSRRSDFTHCVYSSPSKLCTLFKSYSCDMGYAPDNFSANISSSLSCFF